MVHARSPSSRSRLHRFGPIAALGLAILLAACGDSTVQPDMSVVGTYVLEAVDGEDLPFVLIETQVQEVTISAGTFQIFENQTCRFVTRYVITTAEGTRSEDQSMNCLWEGGPASLTFSYSGGFVDEGSVEGSVLTVEAEDAVYTFRKE